MLYLTKMDDRVEHYNNSSKFQANLKKQPTSVSDNAIESMMRIGAFL